MCDVSNGVIFCAEFEIKDDTLLFLCEIIQHRKWKHFVDLHLRMFMIIWTPRMMVIIIHNV